MRFFIWQNVRQCRRVIDSAFRMGGVKPLPNGQIPVFGRLRVSRRFGNSWQIHAVGMPRKAADFETGRGEIGPCLCRDANPAMGNQAEGKGVALSFRPMTRVRGYLVSCGTRLPGEGSRVPDRV